MKTALVTGGGRGIGFGVSSALITEGYALAICGVRREEEVARIEELRESGEVLYVRADVSSRADREALIDSVVAEYGRIDLLVNNAGVAPEVRADILDATEESYERVMSINLKGPYFLTQAVARLMKDQTPGANGWKGAMVFVSSISATIPSTSRGEYCLSKAGVSMATRLFAARLADEGIPVYEIRPGLVATDITVGVREKYDKLIGDGLSLQKRWGTPADVGKAVAMLGRADLAFSTGQVIYVDGSVTKRVL